MKRKNLVILLAVVFISGIIFAGLGYVALNASKGLVFKIYQKIKERNIANIPKAKEPLLISGFEIPDDLNKWGFSSASMELSSEHTASGKYSAKIIYQPSSGASAVKLEKYLEKNRGIANWSGYEILSMDIFNPSSKTEKMILQVKDTKQRKVKINLELMPNSNNRIEVDIRNLWDKLDPSNIEQLNLFLWGNRAIKVFYLDNVRLLPEAAFEKKSVNILSREFLPQKGESVYATGDYFAFNSTPWKKLDPATGESFIEVPISISNYLSYNIRDCFFSGGVPFVRGQLKSLDNLALVDQDGVLVPFQSGILSKWQDGSIRWALVTVKSGLSSLENKNYYLRYAPQFKKQPAQKGIIIKDTPGEVVVNTGGLQFSVSKNNFYLFDKVWLDQNNDNHFTQNEVVSSGNELVLQHNKTEFFANLDKDYKLTIEENGPLRSCIKAEGWFVSARGEKFCRFVVRIYAFYGSSSLKVQHTFIFTGYPENKFHYLYNGKRLPANETIGEVYIKTPFNISKDSKLTFAADNKILQAGLLQTAEFQQETSDRYVLKTSNKILSFGNKLEGWVDVSTGNLGIAFGIKNLWQQFPKGFRFDLDKRCLYTYLWPGEAGELDFKTTQAAYGPDAVARGSAFGVAKTHEVSFYFHNGDYQSSGVKNEMNGLCSDIVIVPSVQWFSDTKAMGKLLPFDSRLGSAENFLSRLFDWGNRQIKDFKWYGMVDFGDTLSVYRKDSYDKSYDEWGWHPEGRHGWFNCEAVGTHSGALIQFMRTHDYKYFNFGANLARHIMDIDTCHYNTVANDKRLKGRIFDDYSRVGSMHRHNGDHWGGRNEEASHTNVFGLVLYYYLTGDQRARDVIDEVGGFFLSERITYFGHPDIAPQRTLANVLWGDVVLFELTGEQKYKIAADKWAGLFYQGQKYDGAWAENYNPVKKRWEGKPHLGFMSGYTLPALIAYHELTGNKAIAGCITSATDFLIRNDTYGGYFDASAYSYWITGQPKYMDNIKKRVDFSIRHQKPSADRLLDGMIYQKLYYARVMEYLYQTPYALEVLADEK